jgi:hypothetical protein
VCRFARAPYRRHLRSMTACARNARW